MSDTQKVIKYVAIAFASLLVFSILSSIMYFILSFGHFFNDDNDVTKNLEGLDITGDVAVLDIDVSDVSVIIEQGDTLSAETNSDKVKVKQEGNKLFITQKNKNWFKEHEDTKLIIYVPNNFTFDGVSIVSGAGKVDIDELSTNKLYLELGAGKIDINNLIVLDDAKIDNGAGKLIISDGKINDLNLDMGVGKVDLTSSIIGDSIIDSGVGSITLNLIGTLDDYSISFDKGLGSSTIDGDKMKDGTYGEGSNSIDIDGGVGSIDINFQSNR